MSETLKQIINGVEAAQKYAEDHGALVNPGGLSWSPTDGDMRLYDSRSRAFVQEVEFDVAVVTSDATKSGGGVGVFVWALSAGAKRQTDATSSMQSRIRFNVPMSFRAQSPSERDKPPTA